MYTNSVQVNQSGRADPALKAILAQVNFENSQQLLVLTRLQLEFAGLFKLLHVAGTDLQVILFLIDKSIQFQKGKPQSKVIKRNPCNIN